MGVVAEFATKLVLQVAHVVGLEAPLAIEHDKQLLGQAETM